MIRNILFDLDDTILDFKACEKAALCDVLTAHGIEKTENSLLRYSEINKSQWLLLEKGEITRAELRVKRFAMFANEFNISCRPEDMADMYEERLCHHFVFIDGAENVLKKLCGDYNLYIVTNGYIRTQTARVEGAGLKKYFKDVFISQAVGFDKPDIRYFEYCFSRIPNFKKEETVIIGDSLSSDIAGGKNSGIKTIFYNAKGIFSSLPDYEIFGLEDIFSLLKTI